MDLTRLPLSEKIRLDHIKSAALRSGLIATASVRCACLSAESGYLTGWGISKGALIDRATPT